MLVWVTADVLGATEVLKSALEKRYLKALKEGSV